MRVPTTLKAIWYIELLGDRLHPFMLFCYPHGKGVFQQRNCTSHMSRLSNSWLNEHFSDFPVINWPPRSSYLNPIEHLWDVLEQDVKSHHTAPTSLIELWTTCENPPPPRGDWKYTRIYNPQRRLRVLVESCRKDSSQAFANILQVITVDRLQKFVEYMPRHLAAIIKAIEGLTRY
ncbi:transposable element Tcb2 transposase [Trichonephila clavipes]|nr:transposable element Tcb2 transposase [Trichonephila clavipes]